MRVVFLFLILIALSLIFLSEEMNFGKISFSLNLNCVLGNAQSK
jgi:hypothetical protein